MTLKEWIIPIIAFALCGGAGWFLAKSKLPEKTKNILGGISFVLGLGLLLSWIFWLRPLFSDAHSIVEITFFEGKKGNTLLVQNLGSRTDRTSSLRLTVLDAETGKQLGKDVTGYSFSGDDDHMELIHMAEDKVWYRDYKNGLHAHDPYSGEVVLSQKQILEKYPQLKGSAKASATTDDGYVLQVKPPNFQLEMLSAPPTDSSQRDVSFELLSENDGALALTIGEGLALRNNDKEDYEVKQLMHCKLGRSGYAAEYDQCLNNQLNMRNARFVANVALLNPKSVLVGYDEYDADRKLKFVLLRIGVDGKVVWEVKEDQIGGKPNLFLVRMNTLYLAVEGKVIAVDAKDGTIKWDRQL